MHLIFNKILETSNLVVIAFDPHYETSRTFRISDERKEPLTAQLYRLIKKEEPKHHIIYFIAANHGLKRHLGTSRL
jgi:hypothetical protein